MNKLLLIVLLAVCLVSTHAFVKRDAPPASGDMQAQLDTMKTSIEDLISKLTEEAKKNLNLEKVQQNINELLNAANKAMNNLVPTTEATQPAA